MESNPDGSVVQILELASATSKAGDSHVVIANSAGETVEDPNQINWREIIEQANNIEDDRGLDEQELQDPSDQQDQ